MQSDPNSQPSSVLDVGGVRKTFESSRDAPMRALRGADLAVDRGEFVAVMGPSGCGKSTLLNVVAGLDVPEEGTVTIAGDPIVGLDEDELARMRRRHIGIVFQFYKLLDQLSVLDNVVLPATVAGASRRQAETRARDLLSLLGLADRGADMPAALSGGQRQRVAIARALSNQPTLLLADEPTGALDSDGSAEVVELLRRLNLDGQTIVMVTHDGSVADGASRVARMVDGRIVDDGRSVVDPSPGGVGSVTVGGRPVGTR